MATVIGLGVQFTANASGMTKGLSDAERAVRNLAQQAASASRLFDSFASSSAVAAQTQQQVATDVAFLGSAFRTGQISAEQYAAELRGIVASANSAAQAFAEGAQVTERVATAEEKRAATLARLAQLLEQGAISQQTYERAAADASGANADAAKAESARAQALARAAQITQANLSPAQKYDQEVQELNQHLQAGRITQETYNAALGKAQQSFAKAEAAAKKYDAAADAAGKGNNLAFNELSGILAAMPGPIGNVAGRLSGLASAGEGLGRVFAGGLSQGFGSLASSAAAIVNPLTAGLTALAAFGAGSAAVAQGLIALEDRVDKLGSTADKLGTSFEFVQVLDESARRSGTSIDAVSAAFGRLQKNVLGIDEESKAAQKALAGIGVTSEQLQSLKPEDQYLLLGQRIAAIENPAKRTATAVSLFGKAGADLLPFFRNLGGAAADLDQVGATLSVGQRQDIDEFGKAMDRLSVATKGAGDQIYASFAPAGTTIANSLADASGAVAKYVQEQNKLAAESQRVRDLESQLITRRATDEERALLNAGKTADEVFQRIQARSRINLETGNWVALTDALVDVQLNGNGAAGAVEQVANAVDQVTQLSTKSQDLLGRAVDGIGDYGQAGFEAALKYQEALRLIDDLISENELSDEQATTARQSATKQYEREIGVIKRGVEERRKAAEEAQRLADRLIEADRDAIDAALERQRIDEQFGGDSQRAKAADSVLAIDREIVRLEQQMLDARAEGDKAAVDAAAARIAQLDQLAARERDIVSGVAQQREEADKKAKQAIEDRQRAEEQKTKRVADLEERLRERSVEIEADRLDALSRKSNQALNVNDVRTTEGAAQFLALATGRQDPAVEEYRKQLRELEKIQREIAKANAAPVEIAG